MCTRSRYRRVAVLVVWCLCAGVVRADPIVTGSVTAQPDGSYLYQYTLTNPGPGAAPLGWFAIEYNASPPTSPSQTGGWLAWGSQPGFFGWANSAGQPGDTTANFSFVSKVAPGLSTYIVVAPILDPTLPPGSPPHNWNEYEGLVVGPATAPEPASVVLLATAGGLLLLRRLRRKPLTRAAN
jgi:hypothetical protein